MEPSPFEAARVEGLEGPSPILLLCEHASCDFPEMFGDLGLDAETRRSHAAWDPGALELTRLLAHSLRAPLVAGNVSRLLYDCNRPPDAATAIPPKSEIYDIIGNQGLSEADRKRREAWIYRPFCACVDRTIKAVKPKAILAIHSFTPIYFGQPREVEVGFLHGSDRRLADLMLARAGELPLKIERNQPYGPEDCVMHSMRIHAESRGLAHVMIEVRNDLLGDGAGQRRIAGLLLPVLREALVSCNILPEEAL